MSMFPISNSYWTSRRHLQIAKDHSECRVNCSISFILSALSFCWQLLRTTTSFTGLEPKQNIQNWIALTVTPGYVIIKSYHAALSNKIHNIPELMRGSTEKNIFQLVSEFRQRLKSNTYYAETVTHLWIIDILFRIYSCC